VLFRACFFYLQTSKKKKKTTKEKEKKGKKNLKVIQSQTHYASIIYTTDFD